MTTLYPLELRVNPEAWRLFTARKGHPDFLAACNKVWERDAYACQFCGFQAQEYQEVINLDQNYRNNKLSNLVTACCFCTQCFFIESVGADTYGGGSLIYFPELSQGELNSLCHVLFCAIANDDGYRETSQSIYRVLKARSQMVDEKFGEGSNEPGVLGKSLFEADLATPEKVARLFKDLRLLPSRARFKVQIEAWAKAAVAVS